MRAALSFALLVFLPAVLAGDDPEENMLVPEIIQYWGYPVEDVSVTTSDGYILHMHRIPHGKNDADPTKKRPVIFLQHGLEASSSSWVTNLPNQALGFVAADNGFDVWMGNVRGNLYSIGHQTLNVSGHDYWKFSWDDMAAKDVEAMVNEVLKRTDNEQLYYVGHSQGTLVMFAKLASDPDFNHKIKKFFALAPVGTVKYIKGLLAFLAKDLYLEVEILYKLLGEDQFLPEDSVFHTAAEAFCHDAFDEAVCDSVLFLIGGPESNQMNATRLPVYLSDEPCGTSTVNVLHWMQMVKSGLIQSYDWGSDKDNIAHYGGSVPPVYDVSKITADVHLYWSDNDWLATEQDIEEHLLPNLQAVLKESIRVDDFNHLDFMWGLRAAAEVYLPVLKTIQDDLKQTSKH